MGAAGVGVGVGTGTGTGTGTGMVWNGMVGLREAEAVASCGVV